MKDELLQGKIKKSNVVVYEVSDEGREHEYNHSRHNNAGHVYYTSFVDFIASLGYEIDKDALYFTRIKIHGVDFYVDLHNATYKSFLKFQRKAIVRKPENRYIALRSSYSSDKSIVKIHFNKEYDSEKIKAKINGYIDEVNGRLNEYTNREKARKDNLNEFKLLMLTNIKPIDGKSFTDIIDSCYISEKSFSLSVKELCSVSFDKNLQFKNIDSYVEPAKTISELNYYFSQLELLRPTYDIIMKFVKQLDALPEHLQNWIENEYSSRVDFQTNEKNYY